MNMREKRIIWTLISVGVLLLLATTALAGSNSTNLPNGAELAVSVDDPVTSTEFLIPTGDADRDVSVTGSASVGLGEPDATFVYVIDGSGSTGSGSGTGCSPVLDCEKKFVIGLNDAAIDSGSVDEVGVVVFGAGAVTGDMSPDGGDQLIIAPDADSYLDTVVNSATSSGGLTQYTGKSSGGGSTNFTAGLQAALLVVNASTNGYNTVMFMSDGASNTGGGGFNAAVTALADAGAVVNSVAVGSGSSCAGGSDGTLQKMADDTGGTCYEVVDPGALPDIIPDLVSTTLESLEIEVDGGGASAISSDDINPDLPAPGAISVDYTTVVPGLTPGDHEICVTANGSDPSGTGSVTQCEVIHLYQLTLAPDGVDNELGTPGQTHEVLATLLGPLGGLAPVSGRTINFSILSGPNAGAPGSGPGVTDASGDAPFSYTAVQGPAGLGTDTIEACVTLNDPLGETGCTTVTKNWVDTTPPESFCDPSVNPDGNEPVAPGKGGQGQNQDGFYVGSAWDAVWPEDSLQLFIVDEGTGTVFGPFASGTTFKYVQAPGTQPKIRDMSVSGDGEVDYMIKGQGDASVFAIDGSANVGEKVSCLVPPPPQ
ncbi:MAG: VWA domain-containing protein [Candidatus Promineifilaceae bacterium]